MSYHLGTEVLIGSAMSYSMSDLANITTSNTDWRTIRRLVNAVADRNPNASLQSFSRVFSGLTFSELTKALDS
jgi:hypothetical protein